MPGPRDQNFLWMFAGAGGIGVESFDNQVKGRRSDDIEVPVNARGVPHLVGRSVKIRQTNIFRHANTSSLQEPPDGKLVNEERIGFIAIKPVAKLCGTNIFAWDERLAPIFFGQAPLPIQEGTRPEIIGNSVIERGCDERRAAVSVPMHLIERELNIIEPVKVCPVRHHFREVAAQACDTEFRTVKNGVRFLLARKTEKHTTNGPGA